MKARYQLRCCVPGCDKPIRKGSRFHIVPTGGTSPWVNRSFHHGCEPGKPARVMPTMVKGRT